jgi:hypothetical protein
VYGIPGRQCDKDRKKLKQTLEQIKSTVVDHQNDQSDYDAVSSPYAYRLPILIKEVIEKKISGDEEKLTKIRELIYNGIPPEECNDLPVSTTDMRDDIKSIIDDSYASRKRKKIV